MFVGVGRVVVGVGGGLGFVLVMLCWELGFVEVLVEVGVGWGVVGLLGRFFVEVWLWVFSVRCGVVVI